MDKKEDVFRILDNMLRTHGFSVVKARLESGLFSHDQERAAAARAWVGMQRLRMYGGLVVQLIGLAAAIATVASLFI